jgi:hypothetical protein
MTCSGGGWIVGDQPIVTATFRDDDNELADPSSVEVWTRSPSGVTVDYTDDDPEVTSPSTGIWKFQFPALDEAGEWYVYIVGDGGGAGAAEQTKFTVRAPKMSLV